MVRIRVQEFLYWQVWRRREKLQLWFVWHLPRWLVYWCAILLISHATTGKYGAQIVSSLTAMEAIDRWDK